MKLTQREKEVLARVCEGAPTKAISHDLGISEQAVKAHIGRLFEKFGVTNRAGLATAASEISLARRQAIADRYHERARRLGRENTRLRRTIAGLRAGKERASRLKRSS